MPILRSQTRLIYQVTRGIAFGLFGFYLLWNAAWLFSGVLPPSILTEATGIPCPTTGVTRGMAAILNGDWVQALLWNPLMPVYAGLLIYSAIVLGLQFIRRKRLVLRPIIARFWMLALTMGWAAKFVIGPQYW